MKLQMFSIYDTVSKLYARPFFDVNEATAKRNLRAAIHDPKSGLAENISDYRLYHIGEFDDQTGEFSLVDHSPAYVDNFVNIGGIKVVQHDIKKEG